MLCRRDLELSVIPRHRADHKSVLFVLQLREKGNGKLSELFHFLLRHPRAVLEVVPLQRDVLRVDLVEHEVSRKDETVHRKDGKPKVLVVQHRAERCFPDNGEKHADDDVDDEECCDPKDDCLFP